MSVYLFWLALPESWESTRTHTFHLGYQSHAGPITPPSTPSNNHFSKERQSRAVRETFIVRLFLCLGRIGLFQFGCRKPILHSYVQRSTTMSTPARTPHRHFLSNIDTSVAARSLDDYSAYSSGLETPLSDHADRRPSLCYSALSDSSTTSLPNTPAGYKFVPSHEATPLYYGQNNNAMRMMHCVKGMPNMVRHVRDAGMTAFDLMASDNNDFSAPVSLSPVCNSFNTSFSAADTWSTMPVTSIPQLGQPFRTPTMSASVFPKQEYRGDSLYSESFMQPSSATTILPDTSFESMASQQCFSPQQLVMPQEVHGQDMMYSHSMDSNMTSPIDQHPLNSSFDSYSSYASWSPGETSPPMSQYVLPDDSFDIRPKLEPGLPIMPLSHAGYGQHSPSKRNRLRQKGSAHKRSRTGSIRYVANHYDVDLAIDSKGVEFDEKAGRYMPKKLGIETKRWKCSVPGCDSRSARKEHLRRHELSHQPEKQFHCNLPKCGRAITRSDNLIQHLMTHARPPKPGKRNNHHSREKIERMVLETMLDKKLAERTITNLGKAIEREQDKWQCPESGLEWNHDADENTADCLRYNS
ncbi:hypothetical protein AMS68_001694 [Peltaster fructicola]|uniref:C2H2-type domain-containing protein n=1 Tax=Peltaster fructicola TaxID=286661 RepID=A0A6H0XN48_9PEZI|nr:hypothetical protein AMS68_001694 [Peltaster fructicola]